MARDVYSQLRSIHTKITTKTIKGLSRVLAKGVEEAKYYIEERWYGEYEPSKYKRTGEILHAFDINCTVKNKTLIGTISIPNNYHHSKSEHFADVRTFDEIHSWFANGYAVGEGRHGEKLDAMQYTQGQLILLRKAISIIEDTLREAGFEVDLSETKIRSNREEERYEIDDDIFF